MRRPKILDALQDISGLEILVRLNGVRTWIRPPEVISSELAEELIEEQGVKVVGRFYPPA